MSAKCDDTRRCIIQFRPHDDEHICSKHVETYKISYYETKIYALSWLITKIILRCTVSKTLQNSRGSNLYACPHRYRQPLY